MTTLTADDATLATLKQATDLVEVRDANDTVVGCFAPVSAERAYLYAQQSAPDTTPTSELPG